MAKTIYTYRYKDSIVRKSNNEYNYGLVNHVGGVISCSKTEKGALALKTTTLNRLKRNLEYSKKHRPENVEMYERDIANTEKWHVVELERVEK